MIHYLHRRFTVSDDKMHTPLLGHEQVAYTSRVHTQSCCDLLNDERNWR